MFRLTSRTLVTSKRCYSIDTSTATLTRSDGVNIISLNRPKVKNAVNLSLLTMLNEHLEAIRFEPDNRVVIINSSTPNTFCAGADLKERKSMTQVEIQQFLLLFRRTLRTIEQFNSPVIAAIDGPALGGGLELALACDLRVAAPTVTKIGLPETRLAIIPGAGGTQRLSRLIGVSKAKELIFASKVMDANEALKYGVLNAVAPEGQSATDIAQTIAGEFLKAGPLALKAAKIAIDSGYGMDIDAGLDLESTAYKTILQSEDRLEGLKAFAEKRAPQYKGK